MSGLAAALDPQGPGARAAADLWWLMLGLGTAVFVLFAGLLAFGLLRRRRSDPVVDDAAERRVVTRWIVLGGVVMPLLVIVVVFGATLQGMAATPMSAAAGALRIEVVGHQFWYEIHYPDQGVVTANELHLPVGREVELELTSDDVVHSFWVPALGGKLDMLPDHPNTLVLQADEPGEHRSQCAEFCGLQHARMGLVVVAEEPDDFDAWLAAEQDEPATAAANGRGAEVFDAAGCATCHAPPDSETGGDAPTLGDLADRRTLAAGMLPNNRENAADWIRDPQAIKPGVEMPSAALTDHEMDALLAYLGYAE